MPNDDQYATPAEFYDLLARPLWDALTTPLRRILGQVAPRPDAALVDLGAGSGLGTRELAAAIPSVPVAAVEPSPAMRAILLARVVDSPDLRERVTIWPVSAQQFPWPAPALAVTALHMIGHLPPDDRRRLFQTVAGALHPSGVFVVNLQPPPEPVMLTRTRFAELPVGEHRYECWTEAEPTGRETMRWRMHYRVLRQDRLLAEAEAEADWWTVGPEGLRREAAAARLVVREEAPDLFALRRSR